jgi:hypothetical protein
MSDIVTGNLVGRVTVISEPKIERGNLTHRLSEIVPAVLPTNHSDRVLTLDISGGLGMNSNAASFKFIKSIFIGGPTTSNNDSTFGRNLICGISQDITEGNPSAPSLNISQNAMWRFKWVVNSGARTISIKCKQAINLLPRPTMTVKSNPTIGINADLIAAAGSSNDWVTIGPISFTAFSKGIVYVELSNNVISYTTDVANGGSDGVNAYFDHIIVT